MICDYLMNVASAPHKTGQTVTGSSSVAGTGSVKWMGVMRVIRASNLVESRFLYPGS